MANIVTHAQIQLSAKIVMEMESAANATQDIALKRESAKNVWEQNTVPTEQSALLLRTARQEQ